MRIAFLTNRTTQYSLPVLKRLVETSENNVVHTFFYNTLKQGRGKFWKNIRDFGWLSLMAKAGHIATGKVRMLIAKRMERGEQWARSSYEYAMLKKLPYSVVQDINAPETHAQLAALDIDLLIVAICKNILKSEVLRVPRYGAVNIHPSLLPKYRGPTPAFWALYHGEQETGVTFHQMTPKIDEGEIVGQYSFSIKPDWGEDDINRYAFDLAAVHVAEVLDRIQNQQKPDRLIAPTQVASYFTFPTPAQRRELRQRRQRG